MKKKLYNTNTETITELGQQNPCVHWKKVPDLLANEATESR